MLASTRDGSTIDIGGADGPGVLGLTQAELDTITTPILSIGDAGDVTLSQSLTAPAGWSTLEFKEDTTVKQDAGASLTVGSLEADAVGTLQLTDPGNKVGTLSGIISGSFDFVDSTDLTVGSVDPNFAPGVIDLGNGGVLSIKASAPGTTLNVVGKISATQASIDLAFDKMNIAAPIDAGRGVVTLEPESAGTSIGVGDAGGTLQLSNPELAQVAVENLTIGNASAGPLTLGGFVTGPQGIFDFDSGSSIRLLQGADVSAGELDFSAGADFLGGSGGALTSNLARINFGTDNGNATADLSHVVVSAISVVIVGGNGNDTFLGSAATEVLQGGTGNDTFTGGGGSDTINGGLGLNTAVYAGLGEDYSVSINPDGTVKVTDIRANSPDGTDRLHDIQKLQFADGTVMIEPIATNDTLSVVETAGPVSVDAAHGVLANDNDPIGTLRVDSVTNLTPDGTGGGVAFASAPLTGNFGTLTLNADGSYTYAPNVNNGLAAGQVGHDVFTYTAVDASNREARATLDITVTAPAPTTSGVMDMDTYVAVESVTGDKIFGTLFDNTGKYSIGSSVTVPGRDNLGGTWTYTVDTIAAADAAHQNPVLSGFVYDTSYFDADNGRSFATYYGDQGLASGDTTKFWSGDNGLGSEGDLAIVDGGGLRGRQRRICAARKGSP